MSAAVRKIQEEVEKRRLAEEAARAAEEERVRKVPTCKLCTVVS